MRYFLPVFLVACLGRVNPHSDDSKDQSSDSGETAVEPKIWNIASVEPPWGSTAGGDVLVIYGEGFTKDMQVRFGSETASVDSLTEETLTVFSPSSTELGPVDVVVALGEEEKELSEAFTYFEDATGLALGFGMVKTEEYLGDYWNFDTSSNTASGFFAFLEEAQDTDLGKIYWGVEQGNCEADAPLPFPTAEQVSAENLVLSDGVTDLTLFGREDGYFLSPEGGLDGVEAPATYGLEEVLDPQGRALSTSAFTKIPSTFEIVSPAMADSDPHFISRTNLEFEWRGASADWMFGRFSLGCYNEGGTFEVLQVATCSSPDPSGSGTLSLGPGLFTGWRTNCLLIVQMTSVNFEPDEGVYTLPHDRSELRMAGGYSQLGILYTQ